MKKIKCKACGAKFVPLKENKYIVTEEVGALQALTTPTTKYECFDCPQCGCQNVLNTRLHEKINKVESEK